MKFLKFNDPAPSRLAYKINRLLYRFWFKLLLMIVFLASSVLLAKKVVYQNVDLNAEIRFLTEESSSLYKGLTELSISKISVKGAREPLKKEIIILVQNAATEGFSALKAQALREKIQDINKVEKAFVKFSSNGVILSIKQDYQGLSSFPLLVGKDGQKNINELLSLVNEIGSYQSEVLYYEWVGERRWDIHMKNDLVFKLPENNLSKGLEVMRMFLNETNKLLKPIVSVDLRNIDKPIIKFRKAPPEEYIHKKAERYAG